MFEPTAMNGEFRDIEEMVQAAGDYVEVTDDLRADTLEAARHNTRRNATRLRILFSAVAVVFLALSAGHLRSRLSSTSPFMAGIGADSDQFCAVALQNASRADVDPSWALVDAYKGIRQRQASFIEDAF